MLGLDIGFKPKAAKPKALVAPVAPFDLTANATASTPSPEFRNVTTFGNDLILTSPTVTNPGEQSAWAYAGTLLPGFIAYATGADQPSINAPGD